METVDHLICHLPRTKSLQGNPLTVIPWLTFLIEHEPFDACYSNYHLTIFSPENSPFRSHRLLSRRELRNLVSTCIHRFVILPIEIVTDVHYLEGEIQIDGHENLVVIDLERKRVERFEPNGSGYDFVDEILIENIVKPLGFSYLHPLDFCPEIGPHDKQKKDQEGYCVTWSALYMHLRLLNQEMEPEEIVDYLLSFTSDELLEMIQKYQSLIEIEIEDVERDFL